MRNEVAARSLLEALVAGILDSGTTLVIDGSFHKQIAPHVDPVSSAPVSPEELARRLCRSGTSRLLDFGCGTGGHRAMLEDFGYDWHGVNYAGGMQIDAAATAASLAASDPRVRFYDGLHLPYQDGEFDVVYSMQTFEHIQSIPVTFLEICRVLKSGGALVGSVSYLEQIHDYSTFNFTPYGFKLALERAGLNLLTIYPGCDAFTFLIRRLLVVTSGSDDNSLTPVLDADNLIGRALGSYVEQAGGNVTDANLLRLMFSTHFAFHAGRA